MNPRSLTSFADELEKIADASAGAVAGAAAVGAAAAFATQFLANKGPKGKLSLQQKLFRGRERVVAGEAKDRKRTGEKATYSDQVKRITAKPMSQLADLAAKHPVQAAIPAAALGATAGATVARILMK